LRWAFNSGQWQPTMEQFVTALSMIQQEERKKVSGYLFKRDVKSALTGRLMIRAAVRKALSLKNVDIKLQRTDNGRPFLEQTSGTNSNFDFNISHQDELVVLASEFHGRIGVDTMAIDRPIGSKSLDKFFETMKRQFKMNEWKFIKSAPCDKSKLFNFLRLWCMKESYVKALGDGIGFQLSRIE
ncbi:hypothetical protein HELRODRAFT_133824, partial [Helobdella robusta]|uniref:L-aminoadipate-semialdehyde dehydrogenase-phosphopantetheinyl transferase n=1 Tax=Helobdella robusta TaxID=6412 RepID=T1EI26_HELRO